ncbi:MAG: hypothetical protein R3F07_04785 [Opitutaceae bacterium]
MSLPDLDSELEAQLRRLRPPPVSPRLEAEIARRLGPVRRFPRRPGRLVTLVAPLAAAAAVWLFMPPDRLPVEEAAMGDPAPAGDVSKPEPGIFLPVRAFNRLYDARYVGVVTGPDGQPARQVVYRYLDTVTWQNDSTRATFEMTVPRDEVYFIDTPQI